MGRIVSISEAAALGLHAMVYLANHGEQPVSVAEIAESLEASANHMSKVLQRLARAGFVRSLRGPAGGFSLAPSAGAITLLEVYETIDGPLRSGACLFDLPVCEGQSCVLGGILASVTEQLRAYLAQTVVSDLQGVVEGPVDPGEAVPACIADGGGAGAGSESETSGGDDTWQHAGR